LPNKLKSPIWLFSLIAYLASLHLFMVRRSAKVLVCHMALIKAADYP
jgi:hypothetical protein